MTHQLVFGNVRGDPITSWKELVEVFEKSFNRWGWLFRGHSDGNWRLETSLERAVLGFALPQPSSRLDDQRKALKRGLVDGGSKRPVLKIEAGLLRQFKRQCHHHTGQIPEPADTLEWLALMQHYGAPTRLLDWTYSFYAAVFFAVDGALPTKKDGTCCVWAVNGEWVRERFRTQNPSLWRIIDKDRNLHKRADTFARVFGNKGRFVCPISPYRLNDRLVIQQGVFLCPGDVSKPFEDNLGELQLERSRSPIGRVRRDARQNVKKIKISSNTQTRADILQHLHRMNMTPATLYPGLGGFAQSLKNMLLFPKLLQSGPRYE
jgi:FRG domain